MISSERGSSMPGWWRQLNGYQWYVFVLAAFGWLFDTMDQQVFTASRSITMNFLLPGAGFEVQANYGRYATALFIVGWATGGMAFGILGDKWGRAKTMAAAIFAYAVFTGLSGLSKTWLQFAVFRLLTGFGVGGEFAVGAALVAEVMPDTARAGALGMLQALSAVGNILGAFLLQVIVPLKGAFGGWQGLYYVGALPALLGVFVFVKLREPDKWLAARRAGQGTRHAKMGSISEMFGAVRWRRNALVGVALVTAGALTLWGAGFWTADLIDSTIPSVPTEMKPALIKLIQQTPLPPIETIPADQSKVLKDLCKRLGPHPPSWPNLSPDEQGHFERLVANSRTADEKTRIKSIALMLQNGGAFVGMCAFGIISARIGHKKTFFFSMLLGWISLFVVFCGFRQPHQIWYMWPLLGIGVLGPFGGYSVYLPELFPTRLRSTGISLCYNVARYLTAGGLFFMSPLAASLNGLGGLEGFRVLSLVISGAYLIGFVALIWAPETSGQPLPED